jgi:hypothetical protein
MIFHAFFVILVTLINTLFATLPPFSITLGGGCADGQSVCPGSDHSAVHYTMFYIMQMDKFLPVHDFAFPAIALTSGFMVAMYAFKASMTGVNIVRGSGA